MKSLGVPQVLHSPDLTPLMGTIPSRLNLFDSNIYMSAAIYANSLSSFSISLPIFSMSFTGSVRAIAQSK